MTDETIKREPKIEFNQCPRIVWNYELEECPVCKKQRHMVTCVDYDEHGKEIETLKLCSECLFGALKEVAIKKASKVKEN